MTDNNNGGGGFGHLQDLAQLKKGGPLPGCYEGSVEFDGGVYRGSLNEDGQFHGFGVASYASGDTYTGEFRDDVFHGRGCYSWADGDKYDGEYANDRQHGYGSLADITGIYTGQWLQDKRHGYGRQVFAGSGEVYEGEWYDDKRHGYGRVTQKHAGGLKNSFYEGGWAQNAYHGRGISKNPDGDVYEGEFQRGKPHGMGVYSWSNGITYLGAFIDGKKHGEGREKLPGGAWLSGRWLVGNADRSVTATRVEAADMDEFIKDFRHMYGFTPKVVTNPVRKKLNDDPNAAAAGSDMGWHADSKDGTGAGGGGNNNNNATNNGDGGGSARGQTPVQLPPVADSAAAAIAAAKAKAHADKEAAAAAAQKQKEHDAAAAAAHQQQQQQRTSPQQQQNFGLSMSASLGYGTSTGPSVTDEELEGYMIARLLGKGSFGSVFEALLPCGKQVCVKQIELGNIKSDAELQALENEINLMKRLHHPNIVEYYGCRRDKEKNTLSIFMELVTGGTVTGFVKRLKGKVPLNTVRSWTRQMLHGVQYLHNEGIIHRDIKGDNILVSGDGIVKLADFGCSKQIDDVCSKTRGCNTMVGTPYWMAPEVIKCEADTGYGAKSDIWSIGCTVVEMMTGRPPWPESDSMWAAVFKIANSTGLPPGIPQDIEKEVMDFLLRCFERDPKTRATADDLLGLDWMQGRSSTGH